jgi:hypothetical protein
LSWLPYGLDRRVFDSTLESMYDFFQLVNTALSQRGMEWIENLVQPAAISTMTSDMAAAAVARYSNLLVVNRHHNGHPDLIPRGEYPDDAIAAGEHGVEIKSTLHTVSDCHSPRNGWYCQFQYRVDKNPIRIERAPLRVKAIYLANVTEDMFRLNDRGSRGTRTATLNKDGIKYLHQFPVYVDNSIN